jgi:medium-chain acyl-[acyl-carrier-protein] hydrolase
MAIAKPCSAPNSWITYPKPNLHAALRLFCFHYAGGGALSFRGWVDHVLPSVEICLIELPGHGMRLLEPAFTQLEPLIQALTLAILPNLFKPFVFFGHSMGSLISFELSQHLRNHHNQSPLHLFTAGHRAPQRTDPDPPIHALPESEFLEQIRRYNGTPEAVLENYELMQLLMPILRADFTIVESYTYVARPLLDCPITALGGWQDWKVKVRDLEAWHEQTNATFSLKMFPGDHFFIHSCQSQVLQFLNQELKTLAV